MIFYLTCSIRGANADMWHAPPGVHDLLRAQFHYKNADWAGNRPFPQKSWAAAEIAKLPGYYVMDLNRTVAATMGEHLPTEAEIAACTWMTERDMQVYSAEYVRTAFQGGLNSYRVLENSKFETGLNSFSGRTIFEAMQHGARTRLLGVHLVNASGHSVAEEQSTEVNRLITEFLQQASTYT